MCLTKIKLNFLDFETSRVINPNKMVILGFVMIYFTDGGVKDVYKCKY